MEREQKGTKKMKNERETQQKKIYQKLNQKNE